MSLKFIIYIFLISIFFTSYNIPFVSFYAPIVLLFFAITFIIILCLDFNKSIFNFKKIFLTKITPGYMYLYFIAYIIGITLVLGPFQNVNIIQALLEIIYKNIICFLLILFLIAHCYNRYISGKVFINIIYITFYCILLLGFIDFIAYYFDIKIFQLVLEHTKNIDEFLRLKEFTKVYVNGLPRIQSIYVEPSVLAENIFLYLPILYKLSLSKYKILKNKHINLFIKTTTIPLIWFDVIFTQSPIWFVGVLISTLLIFRRKIMRFIKKQFIFILVFIISTGFMYCIFNNQISKNSENVSPIERIEIVFTNMFDINKLILAEQSLGTRISNIINQIDIGLKSPIFGCGHTNKTKLMIKQIAEEKSPVAITPEMYHYILKREKPSYQSPALADIFVRYGLIGLLLFYGFYFKLINVLLKINKFYSGVEKKFIIGLAGSLISSVILSCYDFPPNDIQIALLAGIATKIIYDHNKKQKKYYKIMETKQ